ncbi:MAG: DUF4079 domain-containing protein [Synechococcaceae cyanobacterium]|nr:DUF4079 domain-containing protein [Synechococcaceae cyanobacterium]
MEFIDWLWLLHPVLAVVLVYPLLGMVVRLARQTRDRRLRHAKAAPTVGRDHADLGRWLAGAVVAIVLIAEAVAIATKRPLGVFEGGPARLAVLLLVLIGSAVALATLWRVRGPLYRASFALLCWAGMVGLGLQPEVFRRSDNPLDPAFWQSHFWGGIGLAGLMLFSIASRPEIHRDLHWRRLHLSANLLALLIFLAQGISGPRDLLEIPLSWQKPLLSRCDFDQRVCPQPQP